MILSSLRALSVGALDWAADATNYESVRLLFLIAFNSYFSCCSRLDVLFMLFVIGWI